MAPVAGWQNVDICIAFYVQSDRSRRAKQVLYAEMRDDLSQHSTSFLRRLASTDRLTFLCQPMQVLLNVCVAVAIVVGGRVGPITRVEAHVFFPIIGHPVVIGVE